MGLAQVTVWAWVPDGVASLVLLWGVRSRGPRPPGLGDGATWAWGLSWVRAQLGNELGHSFRTWCAQARHGVRQHPWGAPLSALQSGAFLASHSGCNPVPTCLMEHHGCCGSPGW